MSISEELYRSLAAWLVVAIISGVVVVVLWLRVPPDSRRLWPPQRLRAIPWSGVEVVLALFAFIYLPVLVKAALVQWRFFEGLYGSEVGLLAGEDQALRPSLVRQALWAQVFSVPLFIASVIIGFRLLSGTRAYQLGLTLRSAVRDVALGWLSWLILSPFVIGIYVGIVWVFRILLQSPPQEHPLVRLAQDHPLVGDWIAIVLSAILMAPLLEEIMFRGILQPWLARRNWGGHAAMAGSVGWALLELMDKELAASPDARAGVVFVLVMIPGYFVAPGLAKYWLPRPDLVRAIYGTSLLFATLHINVWPSPIPLFVLGLGLGFLAYRTQNLVAPITVHALFNSIATVLLLLARHAS